MNLVITVKFLVTIRVIFVLTVFAVLTFSIKPLHVYAQSSSSEFSQAQKLFLSKRFLEAAPIYYKIVSYPQNQSERAQAIFGLARSLEQAELLISSSKYFSMIFMMGPKNRQFKNAANALGRIDSQIGLGRAQATQLLSKKINPSMISGSARGFYFYYRGLESFSAKRYEVSSRNFSRVNSSSQYYYKSQFHLGVISTLRGNPTRAIKYFQTARLGSPTLREQANLNIARVYYEKKNYLEAFKSYNKISRDSDYWLDTIFESAWAFFLIKKHNHVLGNIHTLQSPFYSDRFYPESFILQAVTFLRLCRYNQVKQSQKQFLTTYRPVNIALKRLLNEYSDRPEEFFNLVKSYSQGTLNRYQKSFPIIDYLSRTNIFKSAMASVRKSDLELAKLSNTPTKWRATGLEDELASYIKQKRQLATEKGGSNLIKAARDSMSYLRRLTSQTDFIRLEMNLGKLDKLKERLDYHGSQDSEKYNLIGGMKELEVGQELEYWPFQGEYWEDELGGYVFNIDSKCSES